MVIQLLIFSINTEFWPSRVIFFFLRIKKTRAGQYLLQVQYVLPSITNSFSNFLKRKSVPLSTNSVFLQLKLHVHLTDRLRIVKIVCSN